MNNVSLTGNIATDLQPRTLPGEKATIVLEARIAVPKRRNHQDADFIDFKAYGATAELLAKHTAKGSRVGLIGQLRVDQWTDKETGNPRSRTYVVAEEVTFLDAKAAA